jgi:hypothetical protein
MRRRSPGGHEFNRRQQSLPPNQSRGTSRFSRQPCLLLEVHNGRRVCTLHTVAHLIAGMVALTCVGLVVAAPIVWCLSQRDAKDWFGIR